MKEIKKINIKMSVNFTLNISNMIITNMGRKKPTKKNDIIIWLVFWLIKHL